MIEAIILHRHPDLMESCAEVLNEEWPRSKASRLHSLQKSCDNLPFNIALVECEENGQRTVIGHSKLSAVQNVSAACFVESVVIAKNKRGQGLGRRLMEDTEKLALRLGYKTVFLTTHDKQKFYECLGYTYCQPVITLGAASTLLTQKQLANLFHSTSICNAAESDTKLEVSNDNNQQRAEGKDSLTSSVTVVKSVPPPTPSPLNMKSNIPAVSSSLPCRNVKNTNSSSKPNNPSPPPPLPPPIPPPPNIHPKIHPVSDSKVVQRMNLADISWMKKVIESS